jgi:2'-5' RNA ligase
MARLFLALWPTAALRRALDAHDRLWSWPAQAARVEPARRHVTLHFLGAVPRSQVGALADALALPCPRTELVFDRPTLWHGGLAVWLASELPPALRDFHQALGRAVAAAGLPVERRPWQPHITFARRAQGARPPEACPPMVWPVDPAEGHVLVESLPQGGYRLLRRSSDPPASVTAADAAG